MNIAHADIYENLVAIVIYFCSPIIIYYLIISIIYILFCPMHIYLFLYIINRKLFFILFLTTVAMRARLHLRLVRDWPCWIIDSTWATFSSMTIFFFLDMGEGMSLFYTHVPPCIEFPVGSVWQWSGPDSPFTDRLTDHISLRLTQGAVQGAAPEPLREHRPETDRVLHLLPVQI